MFSDLPPDEIERRRKASQSAMEEIDREEFARWYQAECDRDYWRNGQCCAGCDFWRSDAGKVGECTAAGIVSGADVLKSLGMTFSSYMPPPGFPYSRSDEWCGKFRDDFDWASLGEVYLTRIGAMRHGKMWPKPGAPK